jgi:hypothetical protein
MARTRCLVLGLLSAGLLFPTAAGAKKRPDETLRTVVAEAVTCAETRCPEPCRGGALLEPVDPRTRFSAEEPRVTAFVRLRHVIGPHVLRWRWYDPLGALYMESAELSVTPAGQYHETFTGAHAIRLRAERASLLAGAWQAVVLLDGAAVATLKFTLSSGPAAETASEAADPEMPFRERFETARLKYESGEREAAADLLRPLCGQNVPAAVRREAGLLLAACELQLGRVSEAEAALQPVLDLEPRYVPDPFRTTPEFSKFFEKARRMRASSNPVAELVSLLDPQGRLGPATKRPRASGGILRKWWLWALVGGAAAGVAVLAASSGSADDYVPPSVTLSVLTAECAPPNLPGQYNHGSLQAEATVEDGKPPYSLSFFLDGMMDGTASGSSMSFPHTFTVQASQTGGCRNSTLRVAVQDVRGNGGRQVEDILPIVVCRCL